MPLTHMSASEKVGSLAPLSLSLFRDPLSRGPVYIIDALTPCVTLTRGINHPIMRPLRGNGIPPVILHDFHPRHGMRRNGGGIGVGSSDDRQVVGGMLR